MKEKLFFGYYVTVGFAKSIYHFPGFVKSTGGFMNLAEPTRNVSTEYVNYLSEKTKIN